MAERLALASSGLGHAVLKDGGTLAGLPAAGDTHTVQVSLDCVAFTIRAP